MKMPIRYAALARAALALLIGTLPVSATAGARFPLMIGIAGDYRVTLEVLPPASFAGPKAELVRDGGDEPIGFGGSQPPNHRLAVIVMDNGRLGEQADVVILSRNIGSRVGSWVRLPVVRAHIAGKGIATP